ncbi:MBL fold metallo-hydrolase [Dehalococcoides mccartyi]|jgi:glyoxylase-like metal-dependent hydrolase (beta-lactamase superfamily II)|uniref:Metallo-beta-lactamase n=4 Tax=Dehalococcoides mccartyi TaxID=61435 RepID=A0A142VBA5_9CHLR|nr:MBL fold metallo-hydrolase [Dehalococcoides mccartyi]AMU86505.1 metallo-beta-lactamase [Dehalococcoides mccartyi]AOV99330.1 hydroxyacylglutathione hydrolase [Dehalococcoides mccartyi]AQX73167.1 MBL fold metallo-hydrolase [Dehalococcoides mccartyi]QBX63835.1 MBL fold metallo-hydrolase [Dehalococcoides mccartyi]BEL00834.1 MBL fold metallo-hydrolase [Dehalococcoides mccartyi]
MCQNIILEAYTNMLNRKLRLGLLGTNCYILGDEESRHGLIIDPAAISNSIPETVTEYHLDVKYIVLTHGHLDHLAGLEYARKLYPEAKLCFHPADASLSENVELVSYLGMSALPTLAPDIPLSEGSTLELGKIKFSVISIPGHTPGGICLYTRGYLFSGDTLFNSGIGRSDFDKSDTEALRQNIVNGLLSLPPETLVFPGHGRETTIGKEKTGNPFI